MKFPTMPTRESAGIRRAESTSIAKAWCGRRCRRRAFSPASTAASARRFHRARKPISGKHAAKDGPSFRLPGPTFKSDPSVKSDNNYYMFIDKYNSLGLGKDEVIVDGANSDSLIAFNQDTKEWIRMRVPYRMGFFSRFFDARIDDPNAGWKGRGAFAANETRGSWLTEGGKALRANCTISKFGRYPLAR